MKLSSRKLELTNGEKFYHYSILLFLAVLPLFSIYFFYKYYFIGDYTGPRKPVNFYVIGSIGIILMIAFYLLQTRRLRFIEIIKKVAYDELDLAIKQCAFELKWEIVKKTKSEIVATRKNSFMWGERITVLIEPDRILINSICDPNKMTALVSYGHNKENIECLEKRISEICS